MDTLVGPTDGATNLHNQVLSLALEPAASSVGISKRTFRWIVQNTITSDTELAILSNVCATWRRWLLEYLMEIETTDTNIRRLILPSMIRAFTTYRQNRPSKSQCISSSSSSSSASISPTGLFCVAWFASEGIQQIPWSQLVHEDDLLEVMLLNAHHSQASRDLTNSILETSETLDRSHSNFSSPPVTTPQEQQFVPTPSPVAYQWKRNSNQLVLSNEWRGYRTPVEILRPFGYSPSFVEEVMATLADKFPTIASIIANDEDEEDAYSTASFAVRGATVARPESYCLCIDRPGGPTSTQQSRLQHLKDRKDLRRTVLPRVIRRHNLPPAVQFLNMDRSSAVTLMTPTLACGTLREPFTLFLVGIATEDGCFMSGLRHRFEVGHLYPKDQLAEVTESSAICVFTEDWTLKGCSNTSRHGEGRDDEDMQDMVDSGDEDIWNAEDESLQYPSECTCVFQGITDKLAVLEDDNEVEGRLMRGALGPGAWHCYTIFVDGSNTKFRIDGIEEPAFAEGRTDAIAFLDGLTLGSDHCYGTSLCCGQGSPGEGEGAIAELAVFSGVMDIRDTETMEMYLMKKHAIPSPAESPWKDDDFFRQARAMFELTGNPRGLRVPLRYFAQSPNVAWKVQNPVSHEPIKRQRIGARNDESSSDW
jgi:hypothetical protein